MKVVFLFPGQGSQAAGMLHRLPSHPEVDAVMEEAASTLQRDLSTLDHDASLKSTVSVQLALLISGVAVGRALLKEGVIPDFVAGHSVGAFGAAVITGVLTFSDALKLVKLRAEWMESLLGHGYGMGVIEGISEKNIRAMVDAAYIRGEEAYISSINSADQITISGKMEHIHNLFSEARGAGARRAQLIKVPVPSHCSLLANISIRLQEAMSHIPLGEPQFPYVANTNARLLRDAASICHDLAQGVSHPVRWYPSTIHLYERGVRLFVEMPPGQVLTNLVRADFKLARAVAMQETSIQSVLHLIHSKKRIYDQSNNTP